MFTNCLEPFSLLLLHDAMSKFVLAICIQSTDCWTKHKTKIQTAIIVTSKTKPIHGVLGYTAISWCRGSGCGPYGVAVVEVVGQAEDHFEKLDHFLSAVSWNAGDVTMRRILLRIPHLVPATRGVSFSCSGMCWCCVRIWNRTGRYWAKVFRKNSDIRACVELFLVISLTKATARWITAPVTAWKKTNTLSN